MSRPSSRLRDYFRPGVAACLLLLTPSSAAAHPHVFVDYGVTVLLAGDAVEGIRLSLTFDDLFSGFILQEFDSDRNQTLSPAEIRRIEEKHLTEFQRAGYHTTINVNGKPAVLPPARSFRASVAKGIVTYEFVLSVRAALATTTALEVLVDDPVYYIAYNPVTVTPQAQTLGAYALECRIVRDKSFATPDVVRCGARRR
jgi:ABC-type uncharacterized transport system substrate-binding protein